MHFGTRIGILWLSCFSLSTLSNCACQRNQPQPPSPPQDVQPAAPPQNPEPPAPTPTPESPEPAPSQDVFVSEGPTLERAEAAGPMNREPEPNPGPQPQYQQVQAFPFSEWSKKLSPVNELIDWLDSNRWNLHDIEPFQQQNLTDIAKAMNYLSRISNDGKVVVNGQTLTGGQMPSVHAAIPMGLGDMPDDSSPNYGQLEDPDLPMEGEYHYPMNNAQQRTDTVTVYVTITPKAPDGVNAFAPNPTNESGEKEIVREVTKTVTEASKETVQPDRSDNAKARVAIVDFAQG